MHNKVSFCRSYPIEILLEKRAKSLAFFYNLTLGFSGSVDPESGMIISLVDVDSWVKEFLQKCKDHKFAHEESFLKTAEVFFKTKGDLSILSLMDSKKKLSLEKGKLVSEYAHEIQVRFANLHRTFIVTTSVEKNIELPSSVFGTLDEMCEKLKNLGAISVEDRIHQIKIRI